jgi:hypothetical protein
MVGAPRQRAMQNVPARQEPATGCCSEVTSLRG